ncbi:hypothetical protein [Anaerovirgula multivorans]|uniref:hypothetical protein n=1 Tax=Anaerovirgula multivorans TaxID=312168 RepID=UPI00113108B8|nr:hypothetical protein [Anaerovirgula multivorans]
MVTPRDSANGIVQSIDHMSWQESRTHVRSIVDKIHGLDWVGDNSVVFTDSQGRQYLMFLRDPKTLQYFYSLIYEGNDASVLSHASKVYATFNKTYPTLTKLLSEVTAGDLSDAGIYLSDGSNGSQNIEIKDGLVHIPLSGGSVAHVPYYRAFNVTTKFDYDSEAGRIYNPVSKSTVDYGGDFVYYDGVSHHAYHDGAVVYRDIASSSYGPISYSEFLSVYSGYGYNYGQQKINGGGYITFDSTSTPHRDNDIAYKAIDIWTIDSHRFDLDIDYNTYLRQLGDSFGRGIFKVHLVKYDGLDWKIVDTIIDVNGNIGCVSVNPSTLCDPGKISKSYNNMQAGEYGLVLELEDTYEDMNKDANGINFYGSVKYSLNILGTAQQTAKDNTQVLVKVIDLSTNNVISENTYGEVMGQHINFTVPTDKTYRVVYYLMKDFGTAGGIKDKGGGFTLSGLTLTEQLQEVPITDIPADYKGAEFKVADLADFLKTPSPDTFKAQDNVQVGRWLWLDAIKVERHKEGTLGDHLQDGMCYPDGIRLFLDNVSSSSSGANSYFKNRHDDILFDGGRIELDVTNPFDDPVELTFSYHTENIMNECEGMPLFEFFNGMFWIDGYDYEKVKEYKDSRFEAINFRLYEYEPIYGGGCSGSNITVDVDGMTETYTDEGVYEFHFDGLPDSFEVSISTEQKGEVLNGIDFRTLFVINNFVVEGCYELVASPFSSKLDFYINGALKNSLEHEKSGEVAHPVNKGLNKYRWVFQNDNDDYTWDYAKINWLRLTNWVCDDVMVTPYCEPKGGDKCVEALIGCLLDLLPAEGCAIVRHVDIDTGQVLLRQEFKDLKEGNRTFEAITINHYELRDDASKSMYVPKDDVCAEVEFKYKRTTIKDPVLDCIEVQHIDVTTSQLLETEYLFNLMPGVYTVSKKEYDGYKFVGAEESYNVNIVLLEEESDKCQIFTFEYEPVIEGCSIGKKIWLFT